MEGATFDRLTRAPGATVSRRGGPNGGGGLEEYQRGPIRLDVSENAASSGNTASTSGGGAWPDPAIDHLTDVSGAISGNTANHGASGTVSR